MHVKNLIEELTKMKIQNTQLRLDLEVLAAKVNKNVVKKVQFPPLQGEVRNLRIGLELWHLTEIDLMVLIWSLLLH